MSTAKFLFAELNRKVVEVPVMWHIEWFQKHFWMYIDLLPKIRAK